MGEIPSVDQLVATARERTGLDDFGPNTYREGLGRLVDALATEAKLSELGSFVLPELLLKHLTQRLQIEDWYRQHPEIDDEPIIAPLIGLGLPRTGSTALSALLGEDPAARSLRRWETAQPCPPPSTVEGLDPRIAQAEAEHAMQNEMAPRLAALVPVGPTSPEECQDLMGLDFRAHYFQAFAFIPSYSDWLLDADLTSTYQYERRALKLLQWGEPSPRPWRLKCPSHLLWLEALDRVFPDARFVMTHRDPTDVMVSVADLYNEVGQQFSEDVDLEYLGSLNVKHWTVAMERLLRFRQGRESRFFDIDFRSMQADPLGEVCQLYDWLGEPVTPEFEAGMKRWWREHADGRDENVHPGPAEFGLDLDQIRIGFQAYTVCMPEWTGR